MTWAEKRTEEFRNQGSSIADFYAIWAAFWGGMARVYMIMACSKPEFEGRMYENSAVQIAMQAWHNALYADYHMRKQNQ